MRKRKGDPLTPRQLERLLRGAENDRDRVILRVLVNTGVRIGELCALSMADIHWQEGLLRVPWLKNRHGERWREVNIRAETLIHLRKFLDGQVFEAAAPVFRGRTGGRITTRSVQRMIGCCAKRAGLERGVTPHDLRHTFASEMIYAGVPLPALQFMMGHASPETTMKYVKRSAKYVETEYRKASMAI